MDEEPMNSEERREKSEERRVKIEGHMGTRVEFYGGTAGRM